MLFSIPNRIFDLYQAIEHGQIEKLQRLIRNGASVNPDVTANTPLHWAIIKFKHINIINILLDEGANIHAKNHENDTPLEIAIHKREMEVIQLLIRRGALAEEDMNLLLLKAIRGNNDIIVEMLISHGIQNNSSIDFQILLNAAISQINPNIIEYIISRGQFLESADKYIPRSLVLESYSKCKQIFQLLKKWGFTTNPDSLNDEDFIFGAIGNGHLQIVEDLLGYGIDVNMVNSKTGLNLLMIACLNNHHQIVEKLLEHNADVNMEISMENEKLKHYLIKFGNIVVVECRAFINLTCLHISVINSDLKMTDILLKYGAKTKDYSELFNLTCVAVRNNCEEIVRRFLDYGINVNDFSSNGKTLLELCIEWSTRDKCYNIAKLLLEKGANISLQIPQNKLFYKAMMYFNLETARLFLNYNADVQYFDPTEDEVFQLAIALRCDFKFIKTLFKLRSSVGLINLPLHSLFYIESRDFLEKILDTLLSYNADINYLNEDKMTPLHTAVKAMSVKTVECLIKYGANIDSLNENNQTALKFGVELYHDEKINLQKIIKILKTQIVKLLVAGLKVNNENRKIVYDSNHSLGNNTSIAINIQELEKECQQEIDEMKKENINITSETDNISECITFEDMLKKHDRFLFRLVNNKGIQKMLKRRVYNKKYPLYIDIIRSRFRNVKYQYEPMNSAIGYFHKNVCQRMPYICVDKIFSYLNNIELKVFIQAMEPFNGQTI